jgi:putative copper export protein
MHVLTIDIEVVRLTLHVLAATIWVGGQIVLAALVGPLRKAAPAAIAPAARAFAWVAWPAFAVLILTGGWILSGSSQESAEWRTTLTIKLLLVLVSGIGAAMHTLVKNPALKGISAGVGLLSALAVVLLGVALAQA